MKITPASGPIPVQPSTPQQASADTRARAIAILTGENSAKQTAPVANPTQVAPEEMTAIKQNVLSVDSQPVMESPEALEAAQATEPEAKALSPEQERINRQFAQLAKQEKTLRAKLAQQEQQLKAREAELAKREQALTKPAEPAKPPTPTYSKDLIKQDPLRVLEEAGVTYEELTQHVLNPPARDPRVDTVVSALEAKIASLEEKLSQSENTYKEEQTKAIEVANRQIKADVVSLVNQGEEFEMVKSMGYYDDVVDLINQTFQKDGIMLSVEEAAQEVENYLVEEALKVTRLSKIKKQLEQSQQAAKTATATQEDKPATPQQPQMRTLTNAAASTRKLSARERAVLAFKGELKG